MVTSAASLPQRPCPPRPEVPALGICPSVLGSVSKQLRVVQNSRAGSHISEAMPRQENLEDGIISFFLLCFARICELNWAQHKGTCLMRALESLLWVYLEPKQGQQDLRELPHCLLGSFGKPPAVILSFQLLSLIWEFLLRQRKLKCGGAK